MEKSFLQEVFRCVFCKFFASMMAYLQMDRTNDITDTINVAIAM